MPQHHDIPLLHHGGLSAVEAGGAFSSPASPEQVGGGTGARTIIPRDDADHAFSVMKFFVWAIGVGATAVRVPLYHAESSEAFEDVPGSSPCSPRFWRSVCSCSGTTAAREAAGKTSFPRCAWWLARGLLVMWPCLADM